MQPLNPAGEASRHFWGKLCRKLNCEDLVDRQFDDTGGGVAELEHIFRSKSLHEWDSLLTREDVCYAPVQDLSEIARDEQILHKEMIIPAETSDHSVSAQAGITP